MSGPILNPGVKVMPYKNLLLHIDDTRPCAGRVDAALALAQAHEAHLTALYIAAEPGLPGYIEGQIPPEILEEQRVEAARCAHMAAETFQATLKNNGRPGECRIVRAADAEVASLIAQQARYADLVIVGQAFEENPGPGGLHMVENLLIYSGRPVLVVPYIGTGERIGRTVTVAWDAGREAARAVADAMPLLERAEKVHVLVVDPRPSADGHGEEPGADLALHLARHGVKAEVNRTEANGIGTGDVILSWLSDADSDLLVMGAYAHSRLRELVLGGVTRRILDGMTVPVLMSH
jgi:nucleotide-binding universal stress UspA family protein